MDLGSIAILVVVVVALIWLVMRLGSGSRKPSKLQLAMNLISALNDNLKIISQKQNTPGDLKKFQVGNWKVNQNYLDFLDKDYIESLKNSFGPMSEYNNQLIQLKINPSSPQPQIDLDKLKPEVVKARAGLAKWIQANVNREATRGFFSWRN